MQRRLWQCFVGVLAAIVAVPAARAGEPVVGVDVGAAIPIAKTQRTMDVGGAIAPFVGYQFGDTIAISLIGQPQLAAFPTAFSKDNESPVTTLFSFTAGPRFSLNDEGKEIYFSAQGGVYTDITGPLNDTAEGYSLAGGFNYDFWRGTSLGIYIRRDQPSIKAARNTDDKLEFLTTGLSLRHRFLPPPPPPAPVVAQAPPPAPPPPPVKKKIVLRGVNFDFDKAVIRPDARPILDEAVATLKQEKDINIAVEGHTDSKGTEAYNQKLSMRRAAAVRDYLAAHGIDAGRMTVAGFGESQPVASNDTSEGRAQNRRVELRVTQQP